MTEQFLYAADNYGRLLVSLLTLYSFPPAYPQASKAFTGGKPVLGGRKACSEKFIRISFSPEQCLPRPDSFLPITERSRRRPLQHLHRLVPAAVRQHRLLLSLKAVPSSDRSPQHPNTYLPFGMLPPLAGKQTTGSMSKHIFCILEHCFQMKTQWRGARKHNYRKIT